MERLVWLIPLMPLVGFALLLLGGRRMGEPRAGWLATAATAASFAASVLVFIGLLGLEGEERSVTFTLFSWVPAGDLSVDVSFLADPLSITMALFITGVSSLIHLYSLGYMHGDENFSKFFLYLNLFVFSMLMLVLSDNLLLTFLGWEGVGACSYFLISFWFADEANASAGKKAFVTNRVGDFGFMVAIFLTFGAFGTLSYTEIFADTSAVTSTTASAIVLLLMLGAAGKSAQFPLYVWLPDAMAGPTPVSALIHAATMVTAGVYLLVRVNPLLAVADGWVLDLLAWVGLATALIAATAAIAQKDIKKVLAYSTISQLGFMFVAVGVGSYTAAIFHMITHAFFKALLFLGSGSVIHAMDGEQSMSRYGGLARFLPVTAITFGIGWLAIAGVPPFSGFWSKDEILAGAWNNNKLLWALLLFAAMLTAFYMSRAVFMTFFGEKKWGDAGDGGLEDAAIAEADEEMAIGTTAGTAAVTAASTESDESAEAVAAHPQASHHPHESPPTMLLPLVLLAALATVAGFINLPFVKATHFLEKWLEPSFYHNEATLGFAGGTKWVLAGVAIVAGLTGIWIAVQFYLKKSAPAKAVELDIFARAWRYDETITKVAGGPGRRAFNEVARFDRRVVDGAVNGVGSLVQAGANWLRQSQTGKVRSYALGIAVGAVILLVYFITRASF